MNGQFDTSGLDPLVFAPAHTGMSIGNFDTLDGTLNDSPFMDFLDNQENNLDFDIDGADGTMIDDLADDGYDDEVEHHDKRKTPEDGKEDDDDEDPKRHEPDEKVAKKPGRKPLTTEPTSVSLMSLVIPRQMLTCHRNARHRIALLNAHSGKEKRNTLRIWRPKLPS